MQIKVITGGCQVEAINNALADIPKGEQVFVVVPDRQTLQIEEMLFDALSITSTFDINVVGLSNLASKYVGVQLQPLSQIQSLMFVKKAIQNVKDKLKFFKSTNINFCKEMFKLISQFKSSSIKAEDIDCAQTLSPLQKKLHDTKIIFEEYQFLTSGYMDAADLLENFNNKILQEGLFSEAYFYFVGFDSFTAKHFEIISSLANVCKGICVSLPIALSKANAYIYDDDILHKLKVLAKQKQVEIEVISPPSTLTGEQKIIAENLFAAQKISHSSDNIAFFEARSMRQEADIIAKLIAFEVYHGKRYKDFSVAASDIEAYGDEIAEAFERNGIPYYLDTSINAGKTYLALVFKKLIAFSYKNYDKDDLLFLLNCPLFEIDEQTKSSVNQTYQGGGKNFFSLGGIAKLKQLVQALNENILNGANEVVEFLRENIEKLDEYSLDEKTLDMEKQIPDILEQMLQSFKEVESEYSLKEFIAAMEVGLQTVEVSAIPSYYDQVYVGDANDSFFGWTKVLFVVGANAGKLPKLSADNSIFTDDELSKAGFKRKVEPTIKMINRRARFKVFSLLCEWKDRCYFTYSLTDSQSQQASPSMVVSELLNMFDKKDEMIKTLLTDEKDIDNLLLSLGNNKVSAEEVLAESTCAVTKALLSEALNADFEKFKRDGRLKNADQLGLGRVVKPTEVEKFYDCPFKVYCENVLKLKEKKLTALTPVEIGNIVHAVLEEYGKKHAYQILSERELGKFVDKKLEEIDFKDLPDVELAKRSLKKDLMRICAEVGLERNSSQYRPWLIEEKIVGDVDGKPFFGRVDRVDKADDTFRIIDYKTGKISTNIIRDLSFGKKLQLFSYAKFIGEKYGLKCAGVYYFDAKAGYKNKQKLLVGVTCEDSLDEGSKNAISQNQMLSLQQKALQMLKKGEESISQGRLEPYPDANSCEFCKYKEICLYDKESGVRLLKGGVK